MSGSAYISDPFSSSSSDDEGGDENGVYVHVPHKQGSPSNLKSSDPSTSDSEEGGAESDTSLDSSEQKPIMAARAYQQEMLEESLKQNIIVAMDTGTGKTHVAVLRILNELERHDSSNKIVWFLVPTVDLAEQQLAVIQRGIPSVVSKLICGRDNVDSWSDQDTWDAVLFNVRVVVSTYQILFDALSHAFVRLATLSLLIFDEAHNFTKKSAGARLMNEMYWPTKRKNQPVPHILGLTASPSMGSNERDIEALEQTLDAICKTPIKQRSELILQANRPEMITETFSGPRSSVQLQPHEYTPSMLSLHRAFREMDIREDPYIIRLRAQNNDKSRRLLQDAIEKNVTYSQGQMKSFCSRTRTIRQQLGPWAADYYIQRVINNVMTDSKRDHDPEKKYLGTVLQKVEVNSSISKPEDLTDKAGVLLKILHSQGSDSVGIVFARERATVAVLTHIIAIHPLTKDQFRVASRVGTSEHSKRESYLDLGHKDNLEALQHFRKKKTNILVATSVLEEGIDVPVCNFVVCFDEPSNLKAFIQRRGRARMRSSKLYLLVNDEKGKNAEYWHELEKEMKRQYEDEERQRKALEEVENSDADTLHYPVLEVPSTGARMTIEDAKSHLDHFCATLSTRKFVDWSPWYSVKAYYKESVSPSSPWLVKAIVHLPVSLAPELRTAESLHAWPSERMACCDAAFQAYSQLYRARLLNDHLLPLKETSLAKDTGPSSGVATVKEQQNPWVAIAQGWRDEVPVHRRCLTFSDHTKSSEAEFELVLPVPVPYLDAMTLFWDSSSYWTVSMDENVQMSQSIIEDDVDHTAAILSSAYGHRGRRWAFYEKQFLARFVSLSHKITPTDIGLLTVDEGGVNAKVAGHLMRHVANENHPYFYVGWLSEKPPADKVRRIYDRFDEDPVDVPYVVLSNWPKYTGYFQSIRPNPEPESHKPYPRVLPASQLKLDGFPAVIPQFGMLIPAVMHALEVRLLAADLLSKRLSKVGITDLSLVATAISAPAAREPTNYEKIEFLGDTILKFCVTVNCCAKEPNWPEGYLSAMKDKIVSNARLCSASREFGLDRYIVTKGLMHKKWKPTFVEDLLENPPSVTAERQMSRKTLADVVEALIGASFLDGGIPRALSCMSLFLPTEQWQSLEFGRQVLFDKAPSDMALPATLKPLEQLLGYEFQKKSILVEAMSHSSYPLAHACFERLEFLGDAVLDYVAVTQIFEISQKWHPMEHPDIHLLRTALVNADFLGFLTMEWHISQERNDVVDTEGAAVNLEKKDTELPLWSFLRHDSGEMGILQRGTAKRFEELRPKIRHAIRSGDHYPWALLSRLQAQKFYSDVFESVLGAVWVDSGSMDECIALAERAGILPYLRRIVKDEVHVLHPKEELGRLAVDKKVVYLVDEREEEDGEKEFFCRVSVGEEVLAEVAEGVSREEARTRAAQEAVWLLKSRKQVSGKG